MTLAEINIKKRQQGQFDKYIKPVHEVSEFYGSRDLEVSWRVGLAMAGLDNEKGDYILNHSSEVLKEEMGYNDKKSPIKNQKWVSEFIENSLKILPKEFANEVKKFEEVKALFRKNRQLPAWDFRVIPGKV